MSDDTEIAKAFLTAETTEEAVLAVTRPMIVKALTQAAEEFAAQPGLVYRGPCDFVLQHGKYFCRIAEVPESQRGLRGYCFGTAIHAAVGFGERYYEGFALAPHNELVHHAWNERPDMPGVVIDRTWWDHPGFVYIGVEFSPERADDATWNGDGSVLLDPERGYPLLKQRWEGEPPGITWPFSERLDFCRRGDKDAARKWMEANKQYLRREG
jgi:hypothetical protein